MYFLLFLFRHWVEYLYKLVSEACLWHLVLVNQEFFLTNLSYAKLVGYSKLLAIWIYLSMNDHNLKDSKSHFFLGKNCNLVVYQFQYAI